VGVAAWLPPEPVDADEHATARPDRARRIVEMIFPLSAAALFVGFAALEQLHPDLAHWYLAFVGIEPDLQGQGVGPAPADAGTQCC
jgi:ribosomal protein S18 acetylase RimI-like enzyme